MNYYDYGMDSIFDPRNPNYDPTYSNILQQGDEDDMVDVIVNSLAQNREPIPEPRMFDSTNFNYDDIDNADIYQAEDGKWYSHNPYVNAIAGIESGHRADAQAKGSSAKGLFQFINSTAQQYGLLNPFDAQQALGAFKKLTKANIKQMQKKGIPINPTTIYLAHQQGVGGLAQIMNHLKNGTPLSEAVLKNVKNNSLGGYKSVQQYYDDWEKRINRG